MFLTFKASWPVSILQYFWQTRLTKTSNFQRLKKQKGMCATFARDKSYYSYHL